MASNVFEVGNLIFVKNAMGAPVWNVEYFSGGAWLEYQRPHWFQTKETLPSGKPVVFLETCKQESLGRIFLKIIGPNGICYVRKEAFL